MDVPLLTAIFMNPMQSTLLASACQRPQKLYRYSQRQWLERSLQLGEFRLCPPAHAMQAAMQISDQILPFGGRATDATAGYLTLSLTSVWDDKLFDTFEGADCCLVIHQTEEFGERVHRAAQRLLPSWAGIDAAISYGASSPLGAAFSRNPRHASEREWLFAWRPMQPKLIGNPVTLRIGSIEGIAELRDRHTA